MNNYIFLLAIMMALSSCTMVLNDKKPVDTTNEVYSVIWKYQIQPEHRGTFEKEYGSTGTWADLFQQSEYYRGSFLHKDEDEPNTYVLIDTWVNKQTYEDFKKQNAQRYNELSKQFEYLYATEEKIGGYNWVK